MDAVRANEILNSEQEHDVFFQGKRIWIREVNSERSTACIFPADEPEDEMTVPVSELLENHS
ncbi:H-type small acid-soluble spore protein [Alteribacter lacisalsi]|nr:H-type small acid-soluble spore protein [Alteribacter lacisalsi]